MISSLGLAAAVVAVYLSKQSSAHVVEFVTEEQDWVELGTLYRLHQCCAGRTYQSVLIDARDHVRPRFVL